MTLHYRASGIQRRRLYGHQSGLEGPLCNTGDGHSQGASTDADVNCVRCLIVMHTKLKVPLTDAQKAILQDHGVQS